VICASRGFFESSDSAVAFLVVVSHFAALMYFSFCLKDLEGRLPKNAFDAMESCPRLAAQWFSMSG
jgi:hypothetical protein